MGQFMGMFLEWAKQGGLLLGDQEILAPQAGFELGSPETKPTK